MTHADNAPAHDNIPILTEVETALGPLPCHTVGINETAVSSDKAALTESHLPLGESPLKAVLLWTDAGGPIKGTHATKVNPELGSSAL